MSEKMKMPMRIDWAIDNLARSVELEGYGSIIVSVNDGKVGHISLFDKDGNQEFFVCHGGSWYEVVEVD